MGGANRRFGWAFNLYRLLWFFPDRVEGYPAVGLVDAADSTVRRLQLKHSNYSRREMIDRPKVFR